MRGRAGADRARPLGCPPPPQLFCASLVLRGGPLQAGRPVQWSEQPRGGAALLLCWLWSNSVEQVSKQTYDARLSKQPSQAYFRAGCLARERATPALPGSPPKRCSKSLPEMRGRVMRARSPRPPSSCKSVPSSGTDTPQSSYVLLISTITGYIPMTLPLAVLAITSGLIARELVPPSCEVVRPAKPRFSRHLVLFSRCDPRSSVDSWTRRQ